MRLPEQGLRTAKKIFFRRPEGFGTVEKDFSDTPETFGTPEKVFSECPETFGTRKKDFFDSAEGFMRGEKAFFGGSEAFWTVKKIIFCDFAPKMRFLDLPEAREQGFQEAEESLNFVLFGTLFTHWSLTPGHQGLRVTFWTGKVRLVVGAISQFTH